MALDSLILSQTQIRYILTTLEVVYMFRGSSYVYSSLVDNCFAHLYVIVTTVDKNNINSMSIH